MRTHTCTFILSLMRPDGASRGNHSAQGTASGCINLKQSREIVDRDGGTSQQPTLGPMVDKNADFLWRGAFLVSFPTNCSASLRDKYRRIFLGQPTSDSIATPIEMFKSSNTNPSFRIPSFHHLRADSCTDASRSSAQALSSQISMVRETSPPTMNSSGSTMSNTSFSDSKLGLTPLRFTTCPWREDRNRKAGRQAGR